MPDKHILFTGTHPERYQHLGRIIHQPMINISPVKLSDEKLQDLQDKIKACDMIIFTSPHAVSSMFQHIDSKAIHTKWVATIGQASTEELLKAGITPNLTAKVETAQGLFEELQNNIDLSGKYIVFPRSNLLNPFLKQALIDQGVHVDEITIYENIKPEKQPLPNINEVRSIIFTSPSTVNNFLEDYGQIPKEWEILARGPKTKKALIQAGYKSKVLF